MGFLPPGKGHTRGPYTLWGTEMQCRLCDSKGKWLFLRICLQDINFRHINFVTVNLPYPHPSYIPHTHTHTPRPTLEDLCFNNTSYHLLCEDKNKVLEISDDTVVLNIFNLISGNQMIYLFHSWNLLEFYLFLRSNIVCLSWVKSIAKKSTVAIWIFQLVDICM